MPPSPRPKSKLRKGWKPTPENLMHLNDYVSRHYARVPRKESDPHYPRRKALVRIAAKLAFDTMGLSHAPQHMALRNAVMHNLMESQKRISDLHPMLTDPKTRGAAQKELSKIVQSSYRFQDRVLGETLTLEFIVLFDRYEREMNRLRHMKRIVPMNSRPDLN